MLVSEPWELLSPTPQVLTDKCGLLFEDIPLFVAFVRCFETESSSVTHVGLKLRTSFLPEPSGVE